MIFITGDTHGEVSRFSEAVMPQEPTLGEKDTLIVCGDFGFLFSPPSQEREFARQAEDLAMLKKKPYTIAFLDGNHENFPMIASYPVEEWHGGMIHRIGANIVHLMRGQMYTIEGKTFFTMGGAYSMDRAMRTEGISYWKEELPNNADYRTAGETLKKNGYHADVILTHTAPTAAIYALGMVPDAHDAELTGFLQWVLETVTFSRWYFGHFHQDQVSSYDPRIRAIYFDTVIDPVDI